MPQTTGKECSTCGRKIATAVEGTWCVSCGKFFHGRCVSDRSEQSCPACGTGWIDPKTLFFYAKRCPVCGHPNMNEEERCRECRRALRWDTRADLVDDLPKLRSLGRERSYVGIVQIVGGSVVLVAAAAYLLFMTVHGGIFVYIVPVIGLGLVGFGLRETKKGRNLSRFCHEIDANGGGAAN